MAELPEGEIIGFYKDRVWNWETGNSVVTEFAEVSFDNGPRRPATKVYIPVERIPAPVRVRSRVRWTDRFGGNLEVIAPAQSRPIRDVKPDAHQDPLF